MKAKPKTEKESPGTILAAQIRAECSQHTKEQRAYYIARGMDIIYGRSPSIKTLTR